MEFAILLFWLSLMLFGLWIASQVVLTHKGTPRRHTSRQKFLRKQKFSPKYHYDVPKTATWHKLLTLLQGDVATANRLIENERRRNSNRSVDWCIEKVLWQLERDRH